MNNGRIERTFTFGPGVTPRIVASNGAGSITVQGAAREDVAVIVTVEPPDALDRGLEVRIVQEGNTVIVEPKGGGLLHAFGGNNARVAIAIATPQRSDITATAGSGEVRVSGIAGEAAVQSGSGKVQVSDLDGTVRVNSGSGKVQGHDLRGTVTCQTGSGSITIEDGEGDFTVRSGSGSVRLRGLVGTLDCHGASGSVTAQTSALSRAQVNTASGSIRLMTPLDPRGEYRFQTASGSVELQVPRETAATMTYQTMSGSVSSDMPAQREGGKRNGTLVVNGGGVPVTMRSMSGSLSIRATTDALPPIATTRFTDAPVAAAAPRPAPESAPQPPPEDEPGETLRILHAVERGELDIDTAMARLAALEEAETVS